jgi:hypothetical protein
MDLVGKEKRDGGAGLDFSAGRADNRPGQERSTSTMTYDQFWRRYLRAHSRPLTRRLHYAGSLLALTALVVAAAMLDWRWLVAAPILGYGFAWAAHGLVEHNRPETFGHPLWSLASDYRMLLLGLTGRLAPHLKAAQG